MAKKSVKPARRAATSDFDIEAFLRKNKTKMKAATQRAKDDDGGFQEYDDGQYKLKLMRAEANKSQAGRPQVMIAYKFLNGDYKGKEYRAYRGIENEDNIFYFLNDVKRLGYDMDEFDPEEFADLLKQMTKDKPTIMATLKTKAGKNGGEFQNLMIRRVIEDDEEDEDEDDDEPKKKKGSKSKKDEDEDEEESDDDDESDDDEEEDEKSSKKSKAKSKKKVEDDDDEEEDEDEDDEDEAPKKKSKKKVTKDEDEDEEEEDEDEEDDEDDKPKKKKGKSDDEDEEEEDEDDDSEEVAVTVGSIVKVKLKAGVTKAEVVDILEDDNAIKIKTKEGKTVKVGADKILSVEEPPKKKGKK